MGYFPYDVQNATWSSKSNGKDKILPDLARAMDRTTYDLV